MTTLEEEICDQLEVRSVRPLTNTESSGCINTGCVYEVDGGDRFVFVKRCQRSNARVMLDGEFCSLKAIRNTETVYVPEPFCVVNIPDSQGNAVLVMENLEGLGSLKNQQEMLGEQMAALHQHNYVQIKRAEKARSWASRAYNEQEEECVRQFGFDATTCCGQIEQCNDWQQDWIRFYACNRLQVQVDLLLAQRSDRECVEEWSKLQLKLDKLFEDTQGEQMHIVPALLHGDLWIGNAGELPSEKPVVYDPASFYGHAEYDLAIAEIFHGFSKKFYDAYHKKMKQQHGFKNRLELYKLFHYLNHWNHFGGGYRSETLATFRRLNRILYASD